MLGDFAISGSVQVSRGARLCLHVIARVQTTMRANKHAAQIHAFARSLGQLFHAQPMFGNANAQQCNQAPMDGRLILLL